MAVINATNLTLSDWATRVDPDGKTAVITELLNTGDDLLEDVVWKQANGTLRHVDTVRTGLPDVYFRAINAGVPASKSTTAKVEEVMVGIEGRSPIDSRLLKLNGNDAGIRLSEDVAFIESMRQKAFSMMIYGDPKKDPECFSGLQLRYNDSRAKSAEMIFNADPAASGNGYASVYMVTWGDTTCHGIFPKGSNAGLEHRNYKDVRLVDARGNAYQGDESVFTWDMGLFVKDWESCGRIANISLEKLRSGEINLIDLLVQLTERVETGSGNRPVIYMPKSVRTHLRLQMNKVQNANLTWDTIGGKRVLAFDNIPVKTMKGLKFTESAYVVK